MSKQTHIITKGALESFLGDFDSELSLSVVSRTNTVAEPNVNVVLHNEHEGLTGAEKVFNTDEIEDSTDWSDVDSVVEYINGVGSQEDKYVLLPVGELYIDELGEELGVEGDNVLGYATSEQSIEADVFDFIGFSGDSVGIIVKPLHDDYEVEFVLMDESSTVLECSSEQDAELQPLYDLIMGTSSLGEVASVSSEVAESSDVATESNDEVAEHGGLVANWDCDDDDELIDFGMEDYSAGATESASDNVISMSSEVDDFDFDFDDNIAVGSDLVVE